MKEAFYVSKHVLFNQLGITFLLIGGCLYEFRQSKCRKS